jgi:hypothetical protein
LPQPETPAKSDSFFLAGIPSAAKQKINAATTFLYVGRRGGPGHLRDQLCPQRLAGIDRDASRSWRTARPRIFAVPGFVGARVAGRDRRGDGSAFSHGQSHPALPRSTRRCAGILT